MSTTQLNLYNDALLILGERSLANLTEGREPRRVLDQIWNGDVVRFCLEKGQWNYAARTSQFDYSPSVEPPFGFKRAFDKPTDWVRTLAVSDEPYLLQPLQRYRDDAGFWFADTDTIYVRYVSDDASYGNDLSLWPETFTRFVAATMAKRSGRRITQSAENIAAAKAEYKECLNDAVGTDSMSGPSPSFPVGSWVRARMWGGYSRSQG